MATYIDESQGANYASIDDALMKDRCVSVLRQERAHGLGHK